MASEASKPFDGFGFVTTANAPGHGLFGGYLVLSPTGRPLEFRCSTPVQPSRAQEILYGRTLEPYLKGEVIGAALLKSSQLPVRLVLTDDKEILSASLLRSELFASVSRIEKAGSSQSAAPSIAPQDSHAVQCEVRLLDEYRLAFAWSSSDSREGVTEELTVLCDHVDLMEPFERIRAALREIEGAPDGESNADGSGSVSAA